MLQKTTGKGERGGQMSLRRKKERKRPAWLPGHLSLGSGRANRALGMNKHRSKWPGQKSQFGRERNQNNCAFFNLKTESAILSVSYRQFSTERREKPSLTRSIFVYTDALLLNIHRRIR